MTSNPNWQRPDDLGRPASASLVDPEDDLPSANYAGDFETTPSRNYDDRRPQPGFGLSAIPNRCRTSQPSGGIP